VHLEIIASPVVIICHPSQFAALLSLGTEVSVATRRISELFSADSFHVHSALNDSTDYEGISSASDEETIVSNFEGLEEPLHTDNLTKVGKKTNREVSIAYCFSSPSTQFTILPLTSPTRLPHINPLIELRTSRVSLNGFTPGESYLSIEDCCVDWWPPTSQNSQTINNNVGVRLFGLAAAPDSIAKSETADDEPMLRVDWITDHDRHSVSDVIAQVYLVMRCDDHVEVRVRCHVGCAALFLFETRYSRLSTTVCFISDASE
jgi:hypothetical protein